MQSFFFCWHFKQKNPKEKRGLVQMEKQVFSGGYQGNQVELDMLSFLFFSVFFFVNQLACSLFCLGFDGCSWIRASA